jgi:hypothetical protein
MLKPKRSLSSGCTNIHQTSQESSNKLSARKLMATVFWDTKGVLLVDFMPQGTTITSEVYCEMLKKLQRAIQNKRARMLTSGVVLLHDNEHCLSNSTGNCLTTLLTALIWLLVITTYSCT